MLTGDNGILTRAGEARDLTGEKQIAERVQLAYLAALTEGKGETTEPNLISELNKEFGAGNYTLKKVSGTPIGVTISGKDYYFDGTVTPSGGGGTEIDIATLQTGTTKPYLPSSSFRVSSEPTEQTVAGGLVITDGGNEFVWVEVPKDPNVYQTAGMNVNFTDDNDYLNIAKDLAVYSGTTLSNNPTSLAEHLPPADKVGKDYTNEYKDVLKSIYQNGGFWVGRYETGIQGTKNATTSARDFGTDYSTEHPTEGNVAVIKENVQPYRWVRWGQAQTLAQGFLPVTNNSNHANLLMGVQWDLVLKFIGKDKSVDSNSSDWGNYRDSVFSLKPGSHYAKYSSSTLSTIWKAYNEDEAGFVESSVKKSQSTNGNGILYTTGANIVQNSKKNICDIAGNVWEWTIERASNSAYPCSGRGGNYDGTGSVRPASGRYSGNTSFSSSSIGFRVSLY